MQPGQRFDVKTGHLLNVYRDQAHQFFVRRVSEAGSGRFAAYIPIYRMSSDDPGYCINCFESCVRDSIYHRNFMTFEGYAFVSKEERYYGILAQFFEPLYQISHFLVSDQDEPCCINAEERPEFIPLMTEDGVRDVLMWIQDESSENEDQLRLTVGESPEKESQIIGNQTHANTSSAKPRPHVRTNQEIRSPPRARAQQGAVELQSTIETNKRRRVAPSLAEIRTSSKQARTAISSPATQARTAISSPATQARTTISSPATQAHTIEYKNAITRAIQSLTSLRLSLDGAHAVEIDLDNQIERISRLIQTAVEILLWRDSLLPDQ